MILPIVAYGDAVLRKETEEIDKNYPDLDLLLEDMFETKYAAKGDGLAAPQIGRAIRIFIVDASGFNDEGDHPELADFKRVYINPIIVEESGKSWKFEETSSCDSYIATKIYKNNNFYAKFSENF